jgi:hypothetical protein
VLADNVCLAELIPEPGLFPLAGSVEFPIEFNAGHVFTVLHNDNALGVPRVGDVDLVIRHHDS